MKKRALAILLAFVLCIPFVLTSCLFPSGGESEETPSFFDEIKDTKPDHTEYSTAYSFIIDAAYRSSGGQFIYASTADLLNEEGTHLVSTHTVYNVLSKEAVYSVSIEYSVAELAYSSLYKSIGVSFGKDVFTVAGTKASGDIEYIVRSETGAELLKSDKQITYLDDGRILTDSKVYELNDNGELALVKDLSDSIISAIIPSLVRHGDRYTYYESSTYTLYVFNEKYEFLVAQPLKPTVSSALANTVYTKYDLENGNVIFQVSGKVCDYSPEVEKRTYDYVAGGVCYQLSTYLFDLERLSYTEITLPYALTSVKAQEKLPYGAQNLALGTLINNKELVYSGNAASVSILLYNDGAYKDMPFASESKVISVLSDSTYIVRDAFKTEVYDKDDRLIGTLDYVSFANERLIVTPTTIYDHSLNVVYSLKENDATLEYLSSNAAVVSYYDDEALLTKYLFINAGKEPSLILTKTPDSSISFHDGYIYTLETVRDENNVAVHKALSIYDSCGNSLSEATLSLNARIITLEYEDEAIIKAENEEGKLLVIVLSQLIGTTCIPAE